MHSQYFIALRKQSETVFLLSNALNSAQNADQTHYQKVHQDLYYTAVFGLGAESLLYFRGRETRTLRKNLWNRDSGV